MSSEESFQQVDHSRHLRMGVLIVAILVLSVALWCWYNRSAIASSMDLAELRSVPIDAERYSGVWFE